MQSIYQTENYNFLFDSYYGTGRFYRLSDNSVSLLETGSDALRLKTKVQRLAAKKLDSSIDSLAATYFYD